MMAERGAANIAAPVVGGFVAEVAGRFGVVVSERSAASAIRCWARSAALPST